MVYLLVCYITPQYTGGVVGFYSGLIDSIFVYLKVEHIVGIEVSLNETHVGFSKGRETITTGNDLYAVSP